MPRLPQRRTARLQFGRISEPGGRYFVTCCTKNRSPIFEDAREAAQLRSVIESLHEHADVTLHAATVMPDHTHLLFTLGARLQLSQIIAKLKTLSRRNGLTAWHWQDSGYEHHLRPAESLQSYGFYVFMNPYAARLCALSESWPWWICPRPGDFAFLATGDGSHIPREWLTQFQQLSTTLPVGE